MTIPKRKNCHARSAVRKAGYRKLAVPTLVTCPNCQEMVQPHRICGSCGYYNSREVVKPEEKEE